MYRYTSLISRIILCFCLLAIVITGNAQHCYSVIPQPKQLTATNDKFLFSDRISVYISEDASNETIFSAEQLIAALRNAFPVEVHLTHKIRKADIVLSLNGKDKIIRKIAGSDKLELPEEARSEGYIVKVTSENIIVIAETEAGLFYGVQTLKQLIRSNKDVKELTGIHIVDWPSMRYRGWMDDISRGPIPTVDFLKECIRKMAEYKQNYFTLYTEHVFRLKNYPDIAPAEGITTEEIRELTEFASRYHIDVVGNFQSFGHMAKILSNPFYTHLGENNDILNPASESTYDFLKNVYSEIVPAYKSPFFNINCDETFGLGEGKSAQLAKEIGIDGLYASHINRIDKLIKPYGKRVMMWGDIAVNNPGIIKKLPKDLIILSWGYHAAESFDNDILPFKNTGFDFMVAPGVSCWNEIWPSMSNAVINISNYTRDGYSLGAMGMMNTAWDDNGHNLFNSNWHGLAWGAECSWNPLPHSKGDIAIEERNQKLESFNASFDKQFFNANGVTEILLSIDSLRNYPVPGILSEWAFWKDILDFNSINTAPGFIEINEKILLRVNQLSALVKEELERTPENSEMLDNALLALDRISFTSNKNIARVLLYRCKELHDSGLLVETRRRLLELQQHLHNIKNRYISLWLRENRPWWLDKNLNDYNRLQENLQAAGSRVFIESSGVITDNHLTVHLKNLFNEGYIVYTLDGREPDGNSPVYNDSILLTGTALIKARTVVHDKPGPVTEKNIHLHKAIGKLLKLYSRYSTYNPAYAAGGDNGLIDGLKGSQSFSDGRWQGYQGQDLDIELDLKVSTEIKRVSVDFLQNSFSWILLPAAVEIFVSDDGINYTSDKVINHDVDPLQNKAIIQTFEAEFDQLKARYLKIIGHYPGPLPAGHHAAGNPSFIFADEIIVE